MAAATAEGVVVILDASSSRLLRVQRLVAGPGAVSCLAAARSTPEAAADVTAAGGGAALPWRERPYSVVADAGAGGLLLAVGGEAGWLRAYGCAPRGAGPASAAAWALELSVDGLASTVAAASFGPWGETLAAACPAEPGTAVASLGRDAAALAAVGGAAGCVSVWERRPARRAGEAAWRLCQQWALAAPPAGCAFAPAACRVRLFEGAGGTGPGAAQALRLLALPAGAGAAGTRGGVGPVVLQGERLLEPPGWGDDAEGEGSDDAAGAETGDAAAAGGAGVIAEDSGVWPDAARR